MSEHQKMLLYLDDEGLQKMAGYLHEMIGDCFELYIYVHSKAFLCFFSLS